MELLKSFNESDHPRSENGRFTSKGKGINSLISNFERFVPIEINAKDFQNNDVKQHIKNVLDYCLKNLRGKYKNEHTNESIEVVKRTFEHILHHGAKKEAHIDSVLAIPEIVKKMLFVGSEKNQDVFVNPDIEKYNYYVSCISVKGKEYIVKSVIGISKGNTKYYDHAVISQSKSEFVETLSEISESRESTNPLFQQDKRLFNILQAESLRKSLDYQIIKIRNEQLSKDVSNFISSLGKKPLNMSIEEFEIRKSRFINRLNHEFCKLVERERRKEAYLNRLGRGYIAYLKKYYPELL